MCLAPSNLGKNRDQGVDGISNTVHPSFLVALTRPTIGQHSRMGVPSTGAPCPSAALPAASFRWSSSLSHGACSCWGRHASAGIGRRSTGFLFPGTVGPCRAAAGGVCAVHQSAPSADDRSIAPDATEAPFQLHHEQLSTPPWTPATSGTPPACLIRPAPAAARLLDSLHTTPNAPRTPP